MAKSEKSSTKDIRLIGKFWLPATILILTISVYAFGNYINSQIEQTDIKTETLIAKIEKDRKILMIIKHKLQYKKPILTIPQFTSEIEAKGFLIDYLNSTVKKFHGMLTKCSFSTAITQHPGYHNNNKTRKMTQKKGFVTLPVEINATFGTYKNILKTIKYVNATLKTLTIKYIKLTKQGFTISASLKGVFEYARETNTK